jgi:hypothetical protein
MTPERLPVHLLYAPTYLLTWNTPVGFLYVYQRAIKDRPESSERSAWPEVERSNQYVYSSNYQESILSSQLVTHYIIDLLNNLVLGLLDSSVLKLCIFSNV